MNKQKEDIRGELERWDKEIASWAAIRDKLDSEIPKLDQAIEESNHVYREELHRVTQERQAKGQSVEAIYDALLQHKPPKLEQLKFNRNKMVTERNQADIEIKRANAQKGPLLAKLREIERQGNVKEMLTRCQAFLFDGPTQERFDACARQAQKIKPQDVQLFGKWTGKDEAELCINLVDQCFRPDLAPYISLGEAVDYVANLCALNPKMVQKNMLKNFPVRNAQQREDGSVFTGEYGGFKGNPGLFGTRA
jgi:hypothetical protein